VLFCIDNVVAELMADFNNYFRPPLGQVTGRGVSRKDAKAQKSRKDSFAADERR
jgi:hypothetical protein